MNVILENLFKKTKPIIGMVHVQALPGTPGNRFTINEIVNMAVKEAKDLANNGIDVVMLENMHDIPYLKRIVGPEIVASMTRIAMEVRQNLDIPLGLQILAGANKSALAVAQSAKFDFIRGEGFIFGHVADEGFFESDAGELLRYRKQIGADDISVFTDIKKKHSSHAITSDVSLAETAEAAHFFKSDGLIITGTATGKSVDMGDLKSVKENSTLPILIGSGATPDSIASLLKFADGAIVGSWLKKDGLWTEAVDPERVKLFVESAKR
jgi:membrane complex biogenesis BtpA family protein